VWMPSPPYGPTSTPAVGSRGLSGPALDWANWGSLSREANSSRNYADTAV
jgi:hypothetical protein